MESDKLLAKALKAVLNDEDVVDLAAFENDRKGNDNAPLFVNNEDGVAVWLNKKEKDNVEEEMVG